MPPYTIFSNITYLSWYKSQLAYWYDNLGEWCWTIYIAIAYCWMFSALLSHS